MSVVIKFYKGCIFHNGRKTYGRFRRKGDTIWDELCEDCFIKASSSKDFTERYELERWENDARKSGNDLIIEIQYKENLDNLP